MGLGSFWQDVRFALRLMRRNPAFTTMAVVTLTLGIGANTAVFSLFDAVVLHPLPYPEPGRLVMLFTVEGASQRAMNSSSPDFEDWRRQARSFETMTAYRGTSFTVTGSRQAEAVFGITATPGLFETFGVTPARGRTFQEGDGASVAVISHALWVRRFASDPAAVGTTMRLDERAFTILGVLPPDFHFLPRHNTEPDVFVPIERSRYRTSYSVSVMARLKRGVTREVAQAEMNAVAARIVSANADVHRRQGVLIDPLHDFVVHNARGTGLMLLGAVAFLLLIACANVANLLLASAVGREREIAIRLAIGASRRRLVRQLLTESVLFALAGAALGLLIASVVLPLIAGIAPAGTFLTRVQDNGIRLNLAVVWFTVGASVSAAVLFGTLPALRATRPMRSSSASPATHRLSGALVSVEVALSFVLLVGAALMMNSLWRLLTVDPGFRMANLLTIGISLPETKYDSDARVAEYHLSVMQRLSAIPGIESAAAVASLPITRDPGAVNSFRIEETGRTGRAAFNEVSAGYFRTMGIAMIQGREFSHADRGGAPGVAIVNRAMARKYWPGQNPLGQVIVADRVIFDHVAGEVRMHNSAQRVEIIGVAGDTRQLGLDDDGPRPMVFLPFTQRPPAALAFVVRTRHPLTLDVVREATDRVSGVDRDVPILDVKTMDQLITIDSAPRRFVFVLVGVFAVVALLLAALGVGGVVAHAVARRTPEVAVRLALGARPIAVAGLLARQHLAWMLGGLAIGVPAAWGLTRLLSYQLFGVTPTDLPTFIAAALVLVSVGVAANLVPASRAMRIAPAAVLRAE